ncbi:MAG: TauD/TfdA family dioxygenase [Gammaproteobacteria bacterium]
MIPGNSPFVLENETRYRHWRDNKLQLRSELDPVKILRVDTENSLAEANSESLKRQIEAYNFVLYEFDSCSEQSAKQNFLDINHKLGLYDFEVRSDADSSGVSELKEVGPDDNRSQYVPYTNRRLNWHTDGYYNLTQQQINAFALYCVHPAAKGGGNYVFDHELMYIRIRDTAPELIAALMAHDLMVIPANIQANKVVRPEKSGPVFSICPRSGALHMRYSARPRNIGWKSDKVSERALNLIREILIDDSGVIEFELDAGQGIICNNILHGRKAFADADTTRSRMLYRARYLDSISFDNPA